MIRDDFAGPGGWDEGLRMIGRTDVVGIEWDMAACETAMAAGHKRIRADVSQYPSEPFMGKLDAYIASPPCQAWSMAGKRKGEVDRANCHKLADRMAAGDDSTDWTEWEDDRSPLVCQPIRVIRDLRPPVVALEEVPPVRGLWEHFGRILERFGYSVWVGVLCAADYGVPQTRRRCILMASLNGTVQPPVPTHSEHGSDDDLFGDGRERWVSMASALGWGVDGSVVPTRGAGMTERHGERNPHPADAPAPTVISKSRSWVANRGKAMLDKPAPTVTTTRRSSEGMLIGRQLAPGEGVNVGGKNWFVASNQANAAVRPVTAPAPAPTILFGHASNSVKWYQERPATTIVGSFSPDVVSPPGYRTDVSRQNAEGGVKVTVAEGGVKVTVAEGGVLQSFPADYSWQGSRTKQYEQVGNAVPPRLAAHVMGTLLQIPNYLDLIDAYYAGNEAAA